MKTCQNDGWRARRRTRASAAFVLLGLVTLGALALAGCGGGGDSNNGPDVLTIDSVVADPSSVFPNGTTTLTCVAIDPEGDELTYTWSAPSGSFPGGSTGSTVQWKAPGATGVVSITVTVSDGSNVVMGSVNVSVTPDATGLQIADVTATPSLVTPGGSVELFCDARDSEGRAISYEWETTDGGFFIGGEYRSATVNWEAPAKPADCTFHVLVRAGSDLRVGAVVVLVRENAPVLDTDPHVLEYPHPETSRSLVLVNAGGTALNWMAARDSVWVTLSGTSGSLAPDERDTLTVTVDRSGLRAGVADATVTLTSEAGIFRVPVAVEVLPEAALIVDPVSLDFGAATDSLTFNISNAGIGTLNWTAHPDTARGLWVSVGAPTSGSLGPGTDHDITVRVDRAGLVSGEHIGGVWVESNGGLATVGIRAVVP